MNFEFSDEQNLLREQAQGFLQDNCPPNAVRAILDGEESYDAALWGKIAEMGWTSTVIPEAFGGLGLSYLELCVIAEELGRVVAPVPFSSSVYLATEALLLAGTEAQKEAWLPKLAAGEAIGTFALSEASGRPSPQNLAVTVSGDALSGTKLPVADGDVADFAVVVARSDSGDGASLRLVDLAAIDTVPLPTLDPTRSHVSIAFDGAKSELLGGEGQGWAL